MESTTDSRLPWRHRLGAGRAPALVLAAALGLSLVLLASAVFSIVSRSHDLARSSVALHALNESVRAETVVRAQVTLAAYLAEIDSVYGTSSASSIRASVADAQGNLVELERITKTVPAGTFAPQTRAAIVRFTRSTRRALDLTTSDRPREASAAVRDEVVPSFVALRDRLVDQRDAALGDVEHTGNVLGRLGRLASFVIAFVLPTVAVVVYRQIMRRSRESVALATALARERGRTKRRRAMLAEQLARFHRGLSRIEPGTPDSGQAMIRRLGWEVEALTTVATETRRLTFECLSLAGELAGLAETLRSVGIDARVATAEGTTWADSSGLATGLRCLALEAEEAGAGRIDLSASVGDGRVLVTVAHDGAALPRSVASLVFEMSHDDERAAVEGGAAPTRLLAARELIEAMGGSLGPTADTDRPGFLVGLPPAGEQPSPGPHELETATPVTA